MLNGKTPTQSVTDLSHRGQEGTLNVGLWAKEANPGDRLIYLKREAGRQVSLGGRAATTMSTAARASAEGLVFIAQRRVVPKKPHQQEYWQYEATRISTPTARLLGLLEVPR